MSIASLLDVLVHNEETHTESLLGSLNRFYWLTPLNNSDEKKVAVVKQKQAKTTNAFNDEERDIVVNICSFLTAKEIHTFRLLNRFTKQVFTLMAGDWSGFWKREIVRQFGNTLPVCSGITTQMSSIVKYLTYHQRVVESEYKHFMSAESFYTCFHEYSTVNKMTGVTGMVCDVGYLESPVVAAVLSRKRYMTMLTVLTDHESDVHKFKKTLNNTHEYAVSRVRSFLPVFSAQGILVDGDLERVIGCTTLDAPGFVGYAVKLIMLRKEHEHMRYSVFWGLFRDLMVFETREQALLYGSTLTLFEYSKFWFTCLDDYTLEELDNTYPRFQSMNFKERGCYIKVPPRETKRHLENQIAAIRYSHSIAKCSY